MKTTNEYEYEWTGPGVGKKNRWPYSGAQLSKKEWWIDVFSAQTAGFET